MVKKPCLKSSQNLQHKSWIENCPPPWHFSKSSSDLVAGPFPKLSIREVGGWYQDISCQGATWEVPLVLLVRPINDQEALCTRHTSCLQQHPLQHSQHIQAQSKPALHLPHWSSLNNVSMWSGCVCLGWYVNLLWPWSNWLDQSNILSQLFHYIIKTICAQSSLKILTGRCQR